MIWRALRGPVGQPRGASANERGTDVSAPQATTPGAVPPGALDDQAFRTMFRGEYGYVTRTLRRLGVRPADLDDRAQDVFVAVHRQRSAYDPARPARPWLFSFAYRVAADHRKSAWSKRAVLDDTMDPADGTPAADDRLGVERDRALVLAALEGIELDRRAVFVLADIDGVAQPEIASVLGLPLGTVYSRLRLAREEFTAAVRRLRLQRGER